MNSPELNNLLQINPYNEHKFKQQDNRWFLSKLPADVALGWNRVSSPYVDITGYPLTPRETLLRPCFDVVCFYYIKYLLDINPTSVIDIGCGPNMFKTFIPNLYGIDLDHPLADAQVEFTSEYAQLHKEKYGAAMAINSLHWTTIDKFERTIYDFASVISPGGRGFITFNLSRMMSAASHKNWDLWLNDVYFADGIIRRLNLDLLVVDQHYVDNTSGNRINGNIRIVFQK